MILDHLVKFFCFERLKMKILYRQNTSKERKNDNFAHHGISRCYFKHIKQARSGGIGTKKRHSHTGFEFHVMIGGRQCYEVSGTRTVLEDGYVLAIPRGVAHSLTDTSYPLEKYAFTFALDEEMYDVEKMSEGILFPIPERVLSNIYAATDLRVDDMLKEILIENIVFEAVCLLLDSIGITLVGSEKKHADADNTDERVELAIQFIKDNIESPPCVSEVASYCYISEKQLNRLFLNERDVSVSAYIRKLRLQRIEETLTATNLSLSQISERFGFPSEHGFNIFFKKYNGMAPGEYRKMTGKGKS